MARKWLRDILLCCIPLIFSPGCQHIGASGSGKGDDLREPISLRQKADSAAAANAAQSDVPASPMPERKIMSTAMAQDPLVHREAKKQADPPPDLVRGLGQLPGLPIPGKPADLPKEPKQDAARPEVSKPAAAGQAGVVTPGNDRPAIEPIQPAAGVQTSPPPALPPLPMAGNKKSDKREYAPFLNALQCMLEEKHQEAIQHLRKYDQETEEFFLRLAPTLIMLVKKPIDELSPPEVSVLSDQLSSILAMLRPRSELGINNMCFCRRIRTFGLRDPLPDNHAFLAGSADRTGELVQLYAELKNFASEPTPEGDYLTKLACTLDLRDAGGKTVWGPYTYDRRETTHRRQTRLNDFYSNFSFYVPAIPPGAYVLTIQIADETNPELRRVARKSLDFRVTPISGQSSSR